MPVMSKLLHMLAAKHEHWTPTWETPTVYPKKYAHGFVVLCFVVVMQSFIMNSHEVFIHIHKGCFAGTGAIVRLPQCKWSKPDGYGKISQCITTTKHSKAKTVCIFLGIYCIRHPLGHNTSVKKRIGTSRIANPLHTAISRLGCIGSPLSYWATYTWHWHMIYGYSWEKWGIYIYVNSKIWSSLRWAWWSTESQD